MTWVPNAYGTPVRECECGKRGAQSYRDDDGNIVHLCDEHAPESVDEGLEYVWEEAPVEVGHG